MLYSVAKLAVNLNVDHVANSVVERLYSNGRNASPRFSKRFQILGYHKVSPDPHPFFAPVDPDTFDQQMQFLSRYYKVLSLRELVERSGRGDIPDRAVAITFDDGYRDNYDYAFPILKKYQFPATIFVATGAIGTGQLIWHDRIFDAFRFATKSHARLRDSRVPELILDSPDARHQSLSRTLPLAKSLFGEERKKFVDDVENTLQPDLSKANSQPRMLNWNQVREMHQTGIDFGSHTVTHTILSRLTRSEMEKELRESRRELGDQLGSSVPLFAYPNGGASDYNPEAKAILRECGYSCAVTCCPGFNHASTDLFELKRGLPWQKEIEIFRFKFFLQRHGLAS